METRILKGETVKDHILEETRNELNQLKTRYGKVPGIAFIGFTGVPLAKYTIPLHVHLAEETGFKVFLEMMDEQVTIEELSGLIVSLNENNEIHAIIVLQPVPSHLNAMVIANKIKPEKEVEGFHPLNMLGTLLPDVIKNRYPMCLPAALEEIFREAGMKPESDKEWVFLVDEEFLLNPLTKMIVHTAAMKAVPHDCSLTFVTKNSSKLTEHCSRADFLVIVTKHPCYVRPEWLNPGVCIIDIYSNLVKEIPSKDDPAKMVPVIRGGISADAAKNIASAILPIPGGLMTTVLAMLFRNAMLAYRNTIEKTDPE